MSTIRKLIKDESGATAIEYGLIAALVSVAIITVLGTLGTNLTATFPGCGRQPVDGRLIPGRTPASVPPVPASDCPPVLVQPGAFRMSLTHLLPPPATAVLGDVLRLLRSDDGGTAIEYGLIAAMIAMTIIGALQELGGTLLGLPLPALIAAFDSALS